MAGFGLIVEQASTDSGTVETSILRSARIARGLTLQAVAEQTKLSPQRIAAIEGGRLDFLPSGFYARAYVRMCAKAIGLDEREIRPVIDAIPVAEVALETIARCRETRVDRGGQNRPAVAVDAAIVAALSASGVLVCVMLTGPGAWDFLSVGIAFLVLALPTLVLYFGLLGATGVGTAGACLFRADFVPRVNGPLDGAELLRRTWGYLRSEAVALVGKPSRLAPSVSHTVPLDNACR